MKLFDKENEKQCFIRAFYILFFLLGILYLFVLPPQCVPDETTHFVTAYYYADIVLEGGSRGEVVEDSVGIVWRRITMREQDAETIERLYSVVLLPSRLYDTAAEKSEGSVDKNVAAVVQTTPYLFVPYLPSAAVIIMCRLLGVGSLTMIYAARIVNFLVSYAIVCKAVRCMPVLKALPMVIALLPMSLHLFSSCSPDSMLIALSLFAAARILELREREEILLKDCVTLGFALAVVVAVKPMYIVMLLLIPLLPRQKINGRRTTAAVYLYLSLFPVLVWIMVYLSHMLLPAASLSIENGGKQLYVLSDFVREPGTLLKLLLHSIAVQFRAQAAGSVGSALGYLNIFLPAFVFCGAWLALLFSIFPVSGETVVLGKKKRLLLGGMFVLSVLVCYVGMLFWETSVGSSEIPGVQGRYFIPVMLPLGLALVPPRALSFFRKMKENWIALGMITVINLYALLNVYGQLSGRWFI